MQMKLTKKEYGRLTMCVIGALTFSGVVQGFPEAQAADGDTVTGITQNTSTSLSIDSNSKNADGTALAELTSTAVGNYTFTTNNGTGSIYKTTWRYNSSNINLDYYNFAGTGYNIAINGGNLFQVYGAYTTHQDAKNNTVTVTDGTVTLEIIGGHSTSYNAENNTVNYSSNKMGGIISLCGSPPSPLSSLIVPR